MTVNSQLASAPSSPPGRRASFFSRHQFAKGSPALEESERSHLRPLVIQARRLRVTPTASGTEALILDIAGAGEIECVLSLRAIEELHQLFKREDNVGLIDAAP
jgi:hypothetical protein